MSIFTKSDPCQRFRRSLQNLRRIRSLTLLGLLTALDVVLGMFDIQIGSTLRVVSLGFLMTAATGMLFGPAAAGLEGMLSDVLNVLLFPKGAYFPGYTLTALLGGLVYGFLLYERPWSLPRLLIAKLIVNVVLNTGLNTLWISLTQGQAMGVLLWPRLGKNLLMLAIEVPLLLVLSLILQRLKRQLPSLRKL